MKSHIRDYATAAFRFYAANGPPQKYKDRIWNDALFNRQQREIAGEKGAPTESAIIHAEAAVNQKIAEIADLEAVEKTLKALEKMDSGMLKAVKLIYMQQPNKDINWGEITDRVHQAELSIPASEQTIYRWLSKARRIFAEERGLRV